MCIQARSAPQTATVHPWSFPSSPWTRLHVDFAGPINGFIFLICVDSFSKWPEVMKMRSVTSASTIRALRSIFCRFGLPRQIVSDNGRQFVPSEFRSFLKDNGIRQITSSIIQRQKAWRSVSSELSRNLSKQEEVRTWIC